MDIRIIKTDEQNQDYLAEVARLAAEDPDPASAEGGRLELLAKLVEDYEKGTFLFAKPDPIDALLFRMEQQSLRQKDIAKLLGGKNRASEILSRKRPLSLAMIRSLHEKLGIPASLLIREPDLHRRDERLVAETSDFDTALDLIVSRGWSSSKSEAAHLWQRLISERPGTPAFLKHTMTFGRNNKTNLVNVWLWLARIRAVADAQREVQARFEKSALTDELIRYVTRLSWMPDGPLSAIRFLEERGIIVVIEPHLPATHLDGAAMLSSSGTPVIGLTLREDRLDNFWFTLTHELVHAWKHLTLGGVRAIADEKIERAEEDDGIEKEANQLAAEILIPRANWKRSRAYLRPSGSSIEELANQLQVHRAIVAGRVRHERKNFALFAKLVGYRQVRSLFPQLRWS
jgi:HTH-type transcriptional regulator / antitoxin HigA